MVNHLEAATAKQRQQRRRAAGTLRELQIQPRTLKRYKHAVNIFFDWLGRERPDIFDYLARPLSAEAVDEAAADYLEALWDDGSSRSEAADTLSGLQHLLPSHRRELKEGWRLLRTWDQNEMPSRAPPLRPEVAIALAGFALADGREDVATAILAGFNGLLRPSEMLISARDCVFDHSQRTCVVNLGPPKAAKARVP